MSPERRHKNGTKWKGKTILGPMLSRHLLQGDLCNQGPCFFTNNAQNLLKVPVPAQETWSRNYMRATQCEKGWGHLLSILSFSYSFEASHIMQICQNRATKNCNRFLMFTFNKLIFLIKNKI